MSNHTYINIQTKGVLDVNQLEELNDNAMLKVKPELWREWDFEKNNELGLDILEMTKGINKKVWWVCSKCSSSYYASVCNRNIGRACPYCVGQKVNHTNSLTSKNPKLASEWHPTKNGTLIPNDVTYGTYKKVWWLGKCGHEWKAPIASRSYGSGCPYCNGKKVDDENSLASKNPKLASEWHPTKNGDLTPHNVTANSEKSIWWLGECGHEWEAVIYSRNRGNGCPYCDGKRVLKGYNDMWTTNPELAKQWHPTKNGNLTPNNITLNSNKKVWWQCEEYHEWKVSVNTRNQGNGCPYCSNQKVLKGFNDMWTTNPKQASLLLNKEDGFKYMQSSGAFVDWKCSCGEIIKHKRINSINRFGLSCPKCSDGITYPEKFMYMLLKELNINFNYQLTSSTFTWIGSKRYDFHIPKFNMIIETHGSQHYQQARGTYGKNKTLAEEQENDRQKMDIAMKNNISYYIVVDCRESNAEFIKNSILNSKLLELLDLNNVNWQDVALKAEQSLVFVASELWNKNKAMFEIINEMKLSRTAVASFLKKGNELGICNYTPSESRKRSQRKSRELQKMIQ